MFGGQPENLFQHALAAPGQDEFGVAAIFCAAFSFDQSFFRQFIEQDDHAAGENPESFGQSALVAGGSHADDPQDSGMARGNTKVFDPLAKAIGRVGAELGEKKGGPGRRVRAGFHMFWPIV